ncbi:hypothetical protein AM350_05300 [Citrobacter freundii]|nr:hypothetical protein AM350_05300 [Citrobacter freundii]
MRCKRLIRPTSFKLVCSFVGLISAAPSGTTVAGCGASALSGLQALCIFCRPDNCCVITTAV